MVHDPVHEGQTPKKTKLVLTFLVTYTVLLPLVGRLIVTKSPTFNEPEFLASGVYLCKTGNTSLFKVNPPLLKIVSTLLPALAGAQVNGKFVSANPLERHDSELGYEFFLANNKHPFLYFVIARFIAFHFLIGIIFLLILHLAESRSLSCLLLFLPLFFLSPFFLGFAYILSQDLYAAVLALLSVCLLHRVIKKRSWDNALLAGFFLGIALLTKFTLVIFFPLFFFLMLFSMVTVRKKCSLTVKIKAAGRDFLQVLRLYLIIAVAGIVVINFGYMFKGSGKLLRSYSFKTCLFRGCSGLDGISPQGANRFNGSGNKFETVLGYMPVLLPADYLQGIDLQRYDFERGMPSYLRGTWSNHGWWYYYLYALLVKTPPGTMAFFLLAIFCSLFLKGYNDSWRDEMVFLVPGIVLFIFVSSQTGFSVHSRYIMPSLIFFYAWACKLGKAFSPNKTADSPKLTRAVRFLTIIFLIWSVASSLLVYPNSTAYFNELSALIRTSEDCRYPKPIPTTKTLSRRVRSVLDAGPLNGPRHLLDSNIDWGQDIFLLESWYREHPEVTDFKTLIWGKYPVELTSIPNNAGPTETPKAGWFAISVNYLYNEEKNFRYFMNFQPVAVIGFTTYVYHLTEEDITQAGFPLPEPEL